MGRKMTSAEKAKRAATRKANAEAKAAAAVAAANERTIRGAKPLRVRHLSEGVCAVSTTGVRQNFLKIYQEVLKEYPTVIVEASGKAVATITRAEGAEVDSNFRTF